VSKYALELKGGKEAITERTVLVDCTTNGLTSKPAVPVFNHDKLILQSVSLCAQTFSASFIGYVESQNWDIEKKNHMSEPVPHPNLVKNDMV